MPPDLSKCPSLNVIVSMEKHGARSERQRRDQEQLCVECHAESRIQAGLCCDIPSEQPEATDGRPFGGPGGGCGPCLKMC